MLLNDVRPHDLLYLDIETVPQFATYEEQPEALRALWDKKAATLVPRGSTEAPQPSENYQQAGIYAEFGRIVCISVGMIVPEGGQEPHFRCKSFASTDERKLLVDFAKMLRLFERRKGARRCAHNGKEFDFPYIARRMLVHGLELPQSLRVAGKKPWEVNFVDTMDLWKFGDYKHYTSLNLLAYIFGIPSPKDDIDGSQVADCYYRQHDLPRIATYCEKDVLTIAQLMLQLDGQPLIRPERVQHISDDDKI